MKLRILIAEDDEDLGHLLRGYLVMNGFEAERVYDGLSAWQQLQQKNYDIILIDVMMPESDGFSLAEKIRTRFPQLPFLFLTARKHRDDVLLGLKLGADDYITKPFDADELILRIHNILSRAGRPTRVKPVPLQIGSYLFDPANLRLTGPHSEKQLTEKESSLLLFLAERSDQVVRRADILSHLWETPDFFSGRSLDVFISRLRGYLAADPAIAIESIRGVGFRLIVY